MTSTPTITARSKLFEQHMQYVAAKDIVSMVNNTYTENAIFYHTLPVFDTPTPTLIQGREQIIKALQFISDKQGDIQVGEPYNFIETENFLAFQIEVKSPNTGKWSFSDLWLIQDGKIAGYFVFVCKLGDA